MLRRRANPGRQHPSPDDYPAKCGCSASSLLVGGLADAAHHQARVGRADDLVVASVVVELAEEEAHRVQAGALLVVGADDDPGAVLLVGTTEHLLLRTGVVLPAVQRC